MKHDFFINAVLFMGMAPNVWTCQLVKLACRVQTTFRKTTIIININQIE
jgi:hypothetical protein